MSSQEDQKDQWEEGIRLRDVCKAIHARSLYYNKLDLLNRKIDELPSDPTPDSLTRFNELKEKSHRGLSLCSSENDFIYLGLINKYELIASNQYYIADQLSFNTYVDKLEKFIRDYTAKLTNAGLGVVGAQAAVDPNLISILNELIKSRD